MCYMYHYLLHYSLNQFLKRDYLCNRKVKTSLQIEVIDKANSNR